MAKQKFLAFQQEISLMKIFRLIALYFGKNCKWGAVKISQRWLELSACRSAAVCNLHGIDVVQVACNNEFGRSPYNSDLYFLTYTLIN